jgi:hypothetical protein
MLPDETKRREGRPEVFQPERNGQGAVEFPQRGGLERANIVG